MKLKYLFASLISCLTVAVGCTEKIVDSTPLENLQVSQSYVGIDATGGSRSISLTATENWEFVQSTIPEWLTVSPLNGSAVENETVTFTAELSDVSRKAELKIAVGDNIQYIIVEQPSAATNYQLATSVTSGKTYMIVAGSYAALALDEDYTYGYLDVTGATANDGVISTSNDLVAFTISETDGGYTIKDCYGRYLYQTGSYDSFNVTDNPSSGHVWTIEFQDDDTAIITNVSTGKFIQYDSQYNSYGSYAEERGTLPSLYECQDAE